MTSEAEIQKIINQKADFSVEVAGKVIEDPSLLDTIFNNISSPTARIKFRSSKILLIISDKQPLLIYPHIKFFIELLDSDNKVLLWNALDVLANLTRVDEDHEFDSIFNRYYGFLGDESMITAGHVVDNSPLIVANRPDLQNKITKRLLKINQTSRDAECGNILGGKVILAFEKYYDQIQDHEAVISFAQELLNSQRNATRTKAEEFLKKYGN